jgi:hypothetical protein
MSLLDIVQLIIAIWGAVLATYLGVRELRKERRDIRVYLDLHAREGKLQVVVANLGHRPTTIVNVAALVIPRKPSKSGYLPPKPFSPITTPDGKPVELPVLLDDGDTAYFVMDAGLLYYQQNDEYEILAYARDSEGTQYTSSGFRYYDSKYDNLVSLSKRKRGRNKHA